MKCSFGIFNIDDVYQIVTSNKKQSFHEVLVNPMNRMYFDIESNTQISEAHISLEIIKLVRLISVKLFHVPLSIASAHKKDEAGTIIKWSYHCVLNVACTKNFNAFLA